MEKHTLSLPPGWKKLQSDKGFYFWHKETNRVQWKFPKEEAEAYEKLKQTHSYVNVKRDKLSDLDDTYDVVKHEHPVSIQQSTPEVSNTVQPNAISCARDSIVSDQSDVDNPPPPLPARNYDEEDYMDCNLSLSPEDKPPPLPERTELSDQLISPNSVQHFLYSSCDSDIHRIPVKTTTKVICDKHSEEGEVDPMYDEIDNVRNGIGDKKLTASGKLEFMIAANPSPGDVAKSEPIHELATSKLVAQTTKVEAMYDEIPSETHRVNQKANSSRSKSIHNSIELEKVEGNIHTIQKDVPPPNHPPPQPPKEEELSLSKQAPTSIPAYEVVPLSVSSTITDDGLMTVVRSQQHELQQSLPAYSVSQRRLSAHVTNKPPNVSINQKANTIGNSSRLMQSLIDSDQRYERLVHDKRSQGGSASVTLPRKFDDTGYSKLSTDAQLMRTGVTIKGSLMSSSNSSLLLDNMDSSQSDDPVPLVLAPNAPAAIIKPRLHTYEDLSLEHEQRTGFKDIPHSSLENSISDKHKNKSPMGSANRSPPKHIKRNRKHSPQILKPESVSDEDFERRLERLDNHFYPEVDIPAWSHSNDPALSPQCSSDIKKVVRKSWNVANAGNPSGLPSGWTREINEQGQVFYWHLPTGNIQYTKPEGSEIEIPDSPLSPTVIKPTTFAAEYIGSVEVSEDKLIKGKSVQVVFNVIKMLYYHSELSVPFVPQLKRHDRVHLQVHGMDLKWLNTIDGSVILTQSINKIRVWGVGQENDRDFGYVSRNPVTQLHQCHVFRCDIAAVGLIQSMLDNHEANKKLSKRQDDVTLINESSPTVLQGSVLVNVPVNSVQRERSVSHKQTDSETNIKEKYKRLEATFIGSRFVTAPHGISVVNESVLQLSLDKSRWLQVYVDVATSHVRIIDKKSEMVLKEHRIRFLSFLGIAQDDKYCGYVVDNGDNQFQFHGFFCHPNSDKLCLALHSACQSRYQRVIDAKLTDNGDNTVELTANSRKPSLLRRIGSWKSSKSKDNEEGVSKATSQNFVVQFVGCEFVNKSKGVDVISEPLQRLAKKTSGIHLVELVVSSSGFTINDPQKRLFTSRQIPTKKVTYCVRVRSHFVFIAKEGSKYVCYMFNESEVDAASIVTAVQKFMS